MASLRGGLKFVFLNRNALQVGKRIVPDIPVAVVNVTPLRDIAESAPPHVSMQFLAASRIIPLARPEAIKAAIEILREAVKDDWICVPGCRLSADLHPFAVKNKCSGVHFTVLSSLNRTSTSGASFRVSLGPAYVLQPHGVRISPLKGKSARRHGP